MNNKLRYLALALLVSVNLNAGEVTSKDNSTGVSKGAPVVAASTDASQADKAPKNDSSDEDESDNGEFFSGIVTSVGDIASTGVTGVETFVTNHPKIIGGVAVSATVIATYALYKWYASANEVADLKAELEEVNAITA